MSSQLFDLNSLGLLSVTGNGAEKLLQGQLSCDMTDISPEKGSMGAHCNPQGRIISLFYATKIDADYHLIMPRTMLPIALMALKKYAQFFKVTLSESNTDWKIAGSLNSPATQAAATVKLPTSERTISLLPSATNIELTSDAEWQWLNMHEGLPAIYPATSGLFLPHDLNLPSLDAVNFSKGCYTGQEIIARMHYRGKPKKHLYRGRCSAPTAPGAPLFLPQDLHLDVATVVDCCQTPHDQYYWMVFTTDETTAEKDELVTADGLVIHLYNNNNDKSESS